MRRCRKRNYTITVGIAGADDCVGVTHLAIMLANYLSSKERCRVAVVDLSKRNSLKVLQNIYEECHAKKQLGGLWENRFQIHKVDYFSLITQRDIANLLQLGYDYVLMDFGKVSLRENSLEILRCHRRILVGSCCEWQQASFITAIEACQSSKDQGMWQYAAFMGAEDIRHRLEKLYRISIHKIPYEADPFRLSRNHFDLLRNVLQEVSECL